MSKTSYLPAPDGDRVIWMNNFTAKIGTYAASVGITAAEVTAVQKDAAMYQYIVNLQEVYKQTLQNVINYKRLLKKANAQQHLSAVLPALPALATAPAPVPEGVFDRISNLVKRIKASVNYTDSMGSDLGIISPVVSIDPSSMQPDLQVKTDAGRPHVKWVRGEADALDLYADRNDGSGFVYLGRFMRNEYIDTTNLASNKVLDEWRYKGIFVIADIQVGLYSPVVEISVKRV
jgi:hypothetical protein